MEIEQLMPEPPRRKRFQIHLSTAIVMMLSRVELFGRTLGFNFRQVITTGFIVGGTIPFTMKLYGWPLIFTSTEFERGNLPIVVDNHYLVMHCRRSLVSY